MPYDRWGMTAAAASTMTGATITDADLVAAESDLAEIIGYKPNPNAYTSTVDDDGDPTDRRVWALGRAIAWHAAYRQDAPAGTGEAVRVASESIGGGDYAVTYAGAGVIEGATTAPRARQLLARYGWLARTRQGHTRN